MQTKLNNLSSCINNEKNISYTNSIQLAKEIYAEIVDNLNKKINVQENWAYLTDLIELSIVISDYPKRIIRKGTKKQSGIKFDTSVRCLLNSNILKFSNVQIQSFMCNYNEGDNELIQTELTEGTSPTHSEICNYDKWTIKNMKYEPTNPTRSSRRSTCEKKIIRFDFSAEYHESNLFNRMLHKDLYSDTIVVVTHSHQEVDCYITLFWDDYYRENRNLDHDGFRFTCREHTTAAELIRNLSDYFHRKTNRALTENNKSYLLSKVHDLFNGSEIISCTDFMKRPMTGSKLSFGQWIMSIIKMLKIPTLEILWRDDFIEGFISKDVGCILPSPGSFILRFSERQPAIGVVLKSDGDEILPWSPYTDGDLRLSNLANLLDEFSDLKYIVQTNGNIIGRHEALEPYTVQDPIDDGYLRRGVSDRSSEPMDSSNIDIDEILDQCEYLLKSYDSTI